MTFTELKQLLKCDPKDLTIVQALGSTLSVDYIQARIFEQKNTATHLLLAQYCILSVVLQNKEKLNKRTFAKYCNRLKIDKSGLYTTPSMCIARAREAVIMGNFQKAAQMFLMVAYHATS